MNGIHCKSYTSARELSSSLLSFHLVKKIDKLNLMFPQITFLCGFFWIMMIVNYNSKWSSFVVKAE